MKLPVDYTKLTIPEKGKVRREYIRLQKGKCWYCDADLKKDPPQRILDKKVTPRLYPNGFFDHPVHLQHDHNTRMTEGAVHAYCNAVLWEYHGK